MVAYVKVPTKRVRSVLLTFCLVAALLLASGLLFAGSQAQPEAPAAVNVPATITSNTTWTKAQSPYYVISDVEIKSGATVTIEPGVRVIFKGKYVIHVRAGSAIIAKGTPAEHISFERNPGSQRWKKIWLYGNTTSYFRYVDFWGGGSDVSGESAILEFDGPGAHVVNNCTVEDSGHQGIAAVGVGLNLTIAGTLLRNNDTYALRVDNGPNVTVTGSTIQKVTDNDGVYIPSRPTAPTLVITGSNFLNGAALSNEMAGATCVYAQGNWWGAASGPKGGGQGACAGIPTNAGTGSTVSAGVDYRNYLGSQAPRVGIKTAPVATFTVSPAGARPVGTLLTFNASGSRDVEDYTSSLAFCWDWEGDGGGCDATAMIPTHSFATGGAHNVLLTVTDTDGLTDTATATVVSSYLPTATFVMTRATWSQVVFDASASSDVETPQAQLKARWDFAGDGVWDTGVVSVTQMMTWTYPHLGRYWPTFAVEDGDGVVSTKQVALDIIPPATSTLLSGGGGVLVSTDGTVQVAIYTDTVTGGELDAGLVVTHTPWLTLPYPTSEGDFTYQGFTLAATSQCDGQPVESVGGSYTITLTYDPDYLFKVLDLSPNEEQLRLYRWSDVSGAWELVPSMLDAGASRLIATTDSFGDFVLLMPVRRVYLPLVLAK